MNISEKDQLTLSIIGALENTVDEVGEDGTLYFEAVLQALTIMYNELTDGTTSTLGMTHVLNQLAVRMVVEQSKEDNQ